MQQRQFINVCKCNQLDLLLNEESEGVKAPLFLDERRVEDLPAYVQANLLATQEYIRRIYVAVVSGQKGVPTAGQQMADHLDLLGHTLL